MYYPNLFTRKQQTKPNSRDNLPKKQTNKQTNKTKQNKTKQQHSIEVWRNRKLPRFCYALETKTRQLNTRWDLRLDPGTKTTKSWKNLKCRQTAYCLVTRNMEVFTPPSGHCPRVRLDVNRNQNKHGQISPCCSCKFSINLKL